MMKLCWARGEFVKDWRSGRWEWPEGRHRRETSASLWPVDLPCWVFVCKHKLLFFWNLATIISSQPQPQSRSRAALCPLFENALTPQWRKLQIENQSWAVSDRGQKRTKNNELQETKGSRRTEWRLWKVSGVVQETGCQAKRGFRS